MQNAPVENFGMLLAETARSWRNKLDQRFKPLGLSQAKWILLLHLVKGGDGITQKELAQRVGIEGPTLVGLLDRLSADGLVERRDSSADRRSKTVHLTARARAMAPQITGVLRELRSELFRGLDMNELQRCMQTLDALKQRLDRL